MARSNNNTTLARSLLKLKTAQPGPEALKTDTSLPDYQAVAHKVKSAESGAAAAPKVWPAFREFSAVAAAKGHKVEDVRKYITAACEAEQVSSKTRGSYLPTLLNLYAEATGEQASDQRGNPLGVVGQLPPVKDDKGQPVKDATGKVKEDASPMTVERIATLPVEDARKRYRAPAQPVSEADQAIADAVQALLAGIMQGGFTAKQIFGLSCITAEEAEEYADAEFATREAQGHDEAGMVPEVPETETAKPAAKKAA